MLSIFTLEVSWNGPIETYIFMFILVLGLLYLATIVRNVVEADVEINLGQDHPLVALLQGLDHAAPIVDQDHVQLHRDQGIKSKISESILW